MICSRQHLIRAETAWQVVGMMREVQTETERLLLDLVERRRTCSGACAAERAAVHGAVEMFLLARLELAVLMEDLANPRGSLRANFYGRMLLLTVYGSALGLCRLLGRRAVREAFGAAFPDRGLEAEIRTVRSRIRGLARRCIREYGDIRHGVVAHRHQDAGRRMQLLEQLCGPHVLDLALELSRAIDEFLHLCEESWNPPAAQRRMLLPVAWQS